MFWGTFPHNPRERHGVGGTSGREGSNGSEKDVPGFYHRGKKYSSVLERASPFSAGVCWLPAWWWSAQSCPGQGQLPCVALGAVRGKVLFNASCTVQERGLTDNICLLA